MIKLIQRFFANPHNPLRVSAVLTMLGLATMVWSLAVPTPLPIMIGLSVGQGLGTMAFALYLIVIVLDIRRRMIDKRAGGAAAGADERAP